ncbi:hypothetical protein [Paraburkholderia azotifigens]|uniref:hypothetical protein n=1 Tax=Paraburkholderia azotifigens TaxID=2057004 RepID=UPI001877D881|nr:hypothetical protein [Paraburkholderia azotifigens]
MTVLPKFVRAMLRLRLALARSCTGALMAGVLLLAAILLWTLVLPGISARVDGREHALAHARSMPAPKLFVSAPALASQRLNAFYATLGDGAHTEEIVSQLFEAAAQTGVVLDKAEYKPAHDVAGRFDTYTIVMPVKGDYSSLRRFSAIVLANVPYAALDDMRFKRNSASDQAIEANLRFTVFLRTATWEPVAERALISALASAPVPASAVASVTASATATPSVPPQAPSSAVVHLELPPLPPSMASTTKSASARAPTAIRTLSASLQTRTPAAGVRR